jgi:hypothetical protein
MDKQWTASLRTIGLVPLPLKLFLLKGRIKINITDKKNAQAKKSQYSQTTLLLQGKNANGHSNGSC